MTDPIGSDYFGEFVTDAIKKENDILDKLLEEAYLLGCGLQVLRNWYGLLLEAEPSESIPVMEIHTKFTN